MPNDIHFENKSLNLSSKENNYENLYIWII